MLTLRHPLARSLDRCRIVSIVRTAPVVSQLSIPDIERAGNLIEAGFWVVFGVVLVVASRRRGPAFRAVGWAAGLVSVLFGLSDLVESSTGAWWRPWWLLLWKALCIAGLVLCFLRYRKLRTAERPQPVTPQAPSSSM
jgi:hypothetical protein